MTPIIIALYSITALILLVGAFLGYKRGFGRSLVRLVYLAVIALASFFIAKAVSSAISGKVLTFIQSYYNETISTLLASNPKIEAIIASIVTAVLSPVVFAILFGLLQLITLIFFKKISTKIVSLFSKEEGKSKASKWTGLATGLVGALIMIFALFSPLTFTASILANTPPDTLAAFDEILFPSEDDFTKTSAMTQGALAKTGGIIDGISLKDLRASLIVFSYLSADYSIEGSTQSVQAEISNVITAAGDGIASYKDTVAKNPEDTMSAYLNIVAAVGANTKHSELLTTVVKEASRAVANLEPETVESILVDYTDYATLISTALPPLFEAVAETPDEEIPTTIEALFGTPPVEPVKDKETREIEENKALKEAEKATKEAEKEAAKEAAEAAKEAEKAAKEAAKEAEKAVKEATTKAEKEAAKEAEKAAKEAAKEAEKAVKEAEKAAKEAEKAAKEAAKEAEKAAKEAEKEAKKNGKTEVKPAETKAPETEKKPDAPKPADPKPEDPKPTDPKPDAPKPAETEPVETTAPETPKEPENTDGKNNGLIGSLINGMNDPTIKDTSIAEKGEMLASNKPLFNSIKQTAFSIISKYDITDEKYAFVYDIIKSGLDSFLYTVSKDPSLTFPDKVTIFTEGLEGAKDTYMKESAYEIPGVTFITSHTALQVIAIFAVDEFTIESYPDCSVPVEDIMFFMGIRSIPDWVN